MLDGMEYEQRRDVNIPLHAITMIESMKYLLCLKEFKGYRTRPRYEDPNLGRGYRGACKMLERWPKLRH